MGKTSKKSIIRYFYLLSEAPLNARRGRTRITAKIYHKPIEPLRRPIEGVTAEAKVGVRNA
jgi:hypothetical protein